MLHGLFHPLIADWFQNRFGTPTEPQARGWPPIAAGRHTLIAAPTGSGKTLSAFMVCLDRLFRQFVDGTLADGVQVVYVSPLKALTNDIRRNLEDPLAEIRTLAAERGWPNLPIRTAVRTGDTPASERQAMLRKPPHILVTTPESLYLLLTSAKGREILRTVKTTIVDEIHALARDKRGSHLSLSLERLAALCSTPPTRIGLSATQRPIEEIAEFLVGGCTSLPLPLGEGRGEGVAAELDSDSNLNSATELAPGIRQRDDEADAKTLTLTLSQGERGQEGSLPLPLGEGRGEGVAAELDLNSTARIEPEGRHGDAEQGAKTLTLTLSQRERGQEGMRACEIINVGHARTLDLAVEVPPSELGAVCTNEQWGEVYGRLTELIQSHRSTLVFVNTRRLAERVAHRLREQLGEAAVASHHGSLSKEIRLDAERRLKAGELKAIVATASLEMGIDIGYIDLVCQIGSPRSIAAFLQRVGRSGHSLGALPKGRLFPLTRDELIECLALIRAVRRGLLDRIEIPQAPLDILAQQIVATVASDECSEDELYSLCCRAWPYRKLSRADFDAIVQMLAEGVKPATKAGAYLHRDQINGRLRARRGARIAALTSGGAIPEQGEYRVVIEGEGTLVGTVDEDFAIDSMAGNIFLLGNTSWRIQQIRPGEVIVVDAQGAPPTFPFWFGEAPGRTIELSTEISNLRRDLAARILPTQLDDPPADLQAWLATECNAEAWAAEQAVRYIAVQKAAVGMVPTVDEILFERFFDESGGMQLVVHSPLGARINRAWGLALRKRFCRSFDFELQAAADDNGVLLSIGPQHSFPIESLFHMLNPQNGQDLLEQAVLAAPMFGARWRWNVTRALAVLRSRGGKRVPPHLQKFRAEDLLAATFPETVGCLENHHGPVVIPDHPLVRQTMHDCLTEAMDIGRWLALLGDVKSGRVKLVPCDTREPSPFSHQLLNANPYAFLDDAPLEERRTRAVSTRRTLAVDDFRDLARLDPAAIAEVTTDAWPTVRDADELHDALLSIVVLKASEGAEWKDDFARLVKARRATKVLLDSGLAFWIAAERWPLVQAVYPTASATPAVELPANLRGEWTAADGRMEIVRGRMQHGGPTTATALAGELQLAESSVAAALEALEGQGVVMRGRFSEASHAAANDPDALEWCERRLLARIHRLTLDGLRRRIQPVAPEVYIDFLTRFHRLAPEQQRTGEFAVREALAQLQGCELSAGAWEEQVLAPRVASYDPHALDHLFLSGELVWGRLRPPKREDKEGAGMAAMTRVMPLALVLREDLPWLLPSERQVVDALAGGNAQEALNALTQRGALFFQELKALTGLLPTQLEEALRELAALGLVTSDTFAAVRAIASGATKAKSRLRTWQRRLQRPASPIGRWSKFPGAYEPPPRDDYLQKWCRQLLARYGVVFRDVLARENAAPPWFELVRVLRKMELRGEVRGGRFIARVGGEQFALESVVTPLRELRDAADDAAWVVITAADPLNLSGILTAGPRIAAIQKSSLILQRGRCVAAKVAGRIEFFAELEPTLQIAMRRALQTGQRMMPAPASPPSATSARH